MPTTYLKRVDFDALVYTHHQLEYLVEEYGADRILMGTDYPADMGEIDPVGMIEGCPGLDEAERKATRDALLWPRTTGASGGASSGFSRVAGWHSPPAPPCCGSSPARSSAPTAGASPSTRRCG